MRYARKARETRPVYKEGDHEFYIPKANYDEYQATKKARRDHSPIPEYMPQPQIQSIRPKQIGGESTEDEDLVPKEDDTQ